MLASSMLYETTGTNVYDVKLEQKDSFLHFPPKSQLFLQNKYANKFHMLSNIKQISWHHGLAVKCRNFRLSDLKVINRTSQLNVFPLRGHP